MTKFEYAMAKAEAMTRLAQPSDKRGTDTRAFYARAAEGFAERARNMTIAEAEEAYEG